MSNWQNQEHWKVQLHKHEWIKSILLNYKIIKKPIFQGKVKQEQRQEGNQGEMLVLWRKISSFPRPECSIHDLISLIKDVKRGVNSEDRRVRAAPGMGWIIMGGGRCLQRVGTEPQTPTVLLEAPWKPAQEQQIGKGNCSPCLPAKGGEKNLTALFPSRKKKIRNNITIWVGCQQRGWEMSSGQDTLSKSKAPATAPGQSSTGKLINLGSRQAFPSLLSRLKCQGAAGFVPKGRLSPDLVSGRSLQVPPGWWKGSGGTDLGGTTPQQRQTWGPGMF